MIWWGAVPAAFIAGYFACWWLELRPFAADVARAAEEMKANLAVWRKRQDASYARTVAVIERAEAVMRKARR